MAHSWPQHLDMSGGAERKRQLGWVRLQECKTINSPFSSWKCPFYSISTIFITGPKRVQWTETACTRAPGQTSMHSEPQSALQPKQWFTCSPSPNGLPTHPPNGLPHPNLLPHSTTVWRHGTRPPLQRCLQTCRAQGRPGSSPADRSEWCSL